MVTKSYCYDCYFKFNNTYYSYGNVIICNTTKAFETLKRSNAFIMNKNKNLEYILLGDKSGKKEQSKRKTIIFL